MRKRRTSIMEIPACESQNANQKDSDFVRDPTSVNLPSDSGSGVMEIQLSECSDAEKGTEIFDYLLYGIVSVIGRRRVMEEAVAVEMGVGGEEYTYFAVFDGHGGSAVANACSLRLHKLIAGEIEGSCGSYDWRRIMRVCFKKMNEEINEYYSFSDGGGGGGPGRTVGPTAVVVVVGREEVVVANCGDSRAIMYRGGIPVPLSHDHKSDRADERARVEAAGGRIINWNGSRVSGVLAASRPIEHIVGAEYLKPYVTSEPEVTISKRAGEDNFIIIASDGLWDVVSNELACEVVKLCLSGRIKKTNLTDEESTSATNAAAILAELAIAKGSKDNISVIVVELKRTTLE